MKCVLDTSAWYALISHNDTAHQQSKTVFSQQPKLIVVFPVFEEIVSLIHNRLGKKTALKSGIELLTSDRIKIIYLSKKDNHEVWNLFQDSPNYLDYVDCSVIWASKKLKLPIFGFDKHFKKMKANLLKI